MDDRKLLNWFKRRKRSFPWREAITPYRVWISEIMLQQTAASYVVEYFNQFMERFPSVEDLAFAKEEEVIKAWEGLGYYSRARNLQKTARIICESYQGTVPSTKEALLALPGIGPYTAGAILSFAFQKKAAAVDGNVLRVMARFHGIEEEIDLPKTKRLIEKMTEEALPEKEAHVVMESLIELGATYCKKRAQCSRCPLISECQAFQKKKVDQIPRKKKQVLLKPLYRFVPILQFDKSVRVIKREANVMEGLYEFPFIELDEKPIVDLLNEDFLLKKWEIKAQKITQFPSVVHTFTRFKAHLFPALFISETPLENMQPIKKLYKLPFSSGHRKVEHFLTQIYKQVSEKS
ncbi:MAG: A/G-specific adenine glycosylase [Simkaniaceae bacterium]